MNPLKTSPLGFFNISPGGVGLVNRGLSSRPRIDLGVADMGNSHHAIPGILPWRFPPSILSRGMLKCGNWVSLPSCGTPGFPPGTPSHQIILGGCLFVGISFPTHQVPTRGVNHSYFEHFCVLAYISIILLGGLKRVCTKMCK